VKPNRYEKDQLPKGISVTAKGYVCSVFVNGTQEQKRFPFGASLATMIAWLEDMRSELRKHAKKPQPVRGTLSADVDRWLDSETRKAMAGYKAVRSGLRAWLGVLVKVDGKLTTTTMGEISRSKITRQHVLDARDAWTAAGIAPKTINNRVQNLGQLFHDLDGSKIETPIDDVARLDVPPSVPKPVSDATIRKVGLALAKDRPLVHARFMVLTSTGMRPATFKRALREDVDLRQHGWLLRPTKGGKLVPLNLTPEMLLAVKRYIELGGFEDPTHATWHTSDYDKILYDYGWPKGVKPYSAKHTVGIVLKQGGAADQDVADHYGHTTTKMAKIYTGVVFSQNTLTTRILAQRKLGFSQQVMLSKKQPTALRVKDGQPKQRLSRTLTPHFDTSRKRA
jgi:hypothetical protein